jgi:hypothetical protein
MESDRKPLTGILPARAGGLNDILDLFDKTEAAADTGPLPKGVYIAVAKSGGLDASTAGTPCFTVVFSIIEGKYTGRQLWMNKYLTAAALPYTVRDLKKLGIDSRTKLETPFTGGRKICKLTVVVHCGDDGIDRNKIRDFEVVGEREPETDPFAPTDVSMPQHLQEVSAAPDGTGGPTP